jgi:hypothetical protein
MPAQTSTVIKVGDRVSAMHYGMKKTGVVNSIGKSGKMIFVKWNGSGRITWMHLTSLTKEN